MGIVAIIKLAMTILGAVDTAAGFLPDKFTRWPGIGLSIARWMYDFGKDNEDTIEKVVKKDILDYSDPSKSSNPHR